MKDVILIGGGIMSANLGAMLKRLAPELSMSLYEGAENFAQEATKSWNNAGTGHAGLCELYLTPNTSADGEVDISKAVEVFAQFEQSLQFWSYAVRKGMVDEPSEFIKSIPHLSFVKTEKQVEFLKARYRSLVRHPFFKDMEFTTERSEIGAWAPLLLEGRDDAEPIAATMMRAGTEVNFGCIAEKLIHWFSEQPFCAAHTCHKVLDLDEIPEGWTVTIKNVKTGEIFVEKAKFVFVGAGGGTLPLLQKSGIEECKTYGGFPVGGQWLVCKNPDLVNKHHAKIYGQAELGTTPATALPHLDTRIIDGERSILFGPFASATTKFTKLSGSCFDLLLSLRTHNIGTFVRAGLDNASTIKYLIQQSSQSAGARIKTLRSFYPDANQEDWELIDAGIRVQVMKKLNGEAVVHYDTELVSNEKGSIAGLLGASPGASITVSVMLETIRKCLPYVLGSPEAQECLDDMIPCHDTDISQPGGAEFYRSTSEKTAMFLKLI